MMEGKKITFGFTKTLKKPQLQQKKPEIIKNKIELITCLEGQEIKLANEKPKVEDNPLVIPLHDSSRTSRALKSLQMRKAVLEGLDVENKDIDTKEIPGHKWLFDSKTEDTLERRAITELIVEARKDPNDNTQETTSKLTLIVKPEEITLEEAVEPTLDDYDSIPINQFGMAMLRGMGLQEELIKKKGIQDDVCPRPKGMGLGADKAIKRQPTLIPPEENEKLEIKKNACVKILAGKYKKQYGQIEGFDDGRIIVKLALGGLKESLGEYLVQAVSKKEFQTYGKVINSAKYEEYKRRETEKDTKTYKTEENYINNESNPKLENYNRNYDKIYNRKTTQTLNTAENAENCKLKIKKEFTIKTEKKDSDKYKSKDEIDVNNYDLKNESLSTSRRYSPEGDKMARSYHDSDQNRHRYDKTDSYSNFKQYNQDNKNNTYSTRRSRSRSRDFKRNKSDSGSDSSDDSPQRRKHKSSKKKSFKSKKNKKNKQRCNSSSEDEKKHKKKTKKSRKSRSRSRSRHRR